MTLQQLKYLLAVVDNGLNITAASERLFTSQPGISKQLLLLEEELSVKLFNRKGKRLAGLTGAGEQVVDKARQILREVDNIKQLSDDMAGQAAGELHLATTHTQARYVMPNILEAYQRAFPDVAVIMHEGTSEQIAGQIVAGEVDFAIASGASELFGDLIQAPVYRWERIVLVPDDHPLLDAGEVDLAQLAEYPLISYTNSFNPDSSMTRVFQAEGLTPRVVFTSHDAEVIKSYVKRGMGVGIVACMAFNQADDPGLKALCVRRVFPSVTTWIGYRRDRFLRKYMQGFLDTIIPAADDQAFAEEMNRLPYPVNQHPNFADLFPGCCEEG